MLYIYLVVLIIGVILAIVGLFYLSYKLLQKTRKAENAKRRTTLLDELQQLQLLEWSDTLSNNDSCSLCGDTFPRRIEILVFPCKHACHLPCADEWISRGKLTCPQCQKEIIPNSGRFREEDFLPSSVAQADTVITCFHGTERTAERIPLLKPTLFQELKLRLLSKRHIYLRVPSDLSEGKRKNPSPLKVQRNPQASSKRQSCTGGDTAKSDTLASCSFSTVQSDKVSDSEFIVSEEILRRFSLSPRSLFCTPATLIQQKLEQAGTSTAN